MIGLRILHTSDWHLGKSIHGQSLDEDQEHAVACIEKELGNGYRCLIIAGDVFDRAIPPTSALDILSGFLERIVSRGIEVVIIPGNHDSPERLGFASGILGSRGVHIRCRYEECIDPIVIDDEVQIFTLPFVEEAVVRERFPDVGITDHESAVGFLLTNMREVRDPDIPAILLAHEYTGHGVITSDSERELLIGNQGRMPTDLFDGFDYVALGHLHGPQTASKESNAYYSGSILQYSFSECDHEKGMVSIEVNGGELRLRKVPIPPLRRMTVIEGALNEILSDPIHSSRAEDYVSVRLSDKGALFDIQGRLKERFPYLLEVQLPYLMADRPDSVSVRKALDSPKDLFSLFLDYFGWDDPDKRRKAFEIFEAARVRNERSFRRGSE